MPSSVFGSVAASLVGGLFSGLLSGGKESAPAPTPALVTPMPSPNDEAVKAAKKRSIAAMTQRQGRASTILSGEDATGGGGSTLGG